MSGDLSRNEVGYTHTGFCNDQLVHSDTY